MDGRMRAWGMEKGSPERNLLWRPVVMGLVVGG